MKTIKTFFILILLIGAALLFYKYDIDRKKEQNRQIVILDSEYKEFEHIVAKVDDAAIIRKALKSVGVLTVLEGVEEYKQVVEEENWYSYRGIRIDWHYRFALAMNFEDIDISVYDRKVNVSLDSSKLYIQFIEKTKESMSHSEATLFAKKFSSQEISALEKTIVDKVEQRIKENYSYWNDAHKSLEVNIKKICNNLGYYDINFEENNEKNDETK